jgi:hypothetical protein
MIEIIDEQLTMHVGILVIPTGIDGQEKGEEDASKDADEMPTGIERGGRRQQGCGRNPNGHK